MRHPTTRALYSYWNRLRGLRPAPERIEIEPRAIVSELGDVFLLEGPESDFRFRLAGSRMTFALGRMLTGSHYDDLWAEDSQVGAAKALATVTGDATPFLIGIRTFTETDCEQETAPANRPNWANFRRLDRFGQPDRRSEHAIAGEMILLPLRHAGRDGTRIIGALSLFDPPIIRPTQERLIAITSTRALGSEAQPLNGSRLLSGSLARTIIRRHGHLVVMRGFRDDPQLPDERDSERG